MASLRYASRLARHCRFLSDAEVATLCAACGNVATKARRASPEVNVGLMIHLTEARLPAFARKWVSPGLFFEDGCDSIHNLMNRLDRRFACLHGEANPVRRLKPSESSPDMTQRSSRVSASPAGHAGHACALEQRQKKSTMVMLATYVGMNKGEKPERAPP